MNFYKALIAATVASFLATVPSISGFTTPATFTVRPMQAASQVEEIGDFAVAGFGQRSRRGSPKPLFMAAQSFSRDLKSYPEGMSLEEEQDFIRQGFEEIYADQEDAPDIDEMMKAVAVFQSRKEPDASEMRDEVGIAGVLPCQLTIAIDAIAICLEVIGLGGKGANKVATKMFSKLPVRVQNKIIDLLKNMNESNFAELAFDIISEVYNHLSWGALFDSFSEIGVFDAMGFVGTFLSTFVLSAGAGLVVRFGLLAASFIKLIADIKKCDF